MSWDVSVFSCKTPPPPMDQIPDDWRADVMGSGDEVRGKISQFLAGVDWSDPTWGSYRGGGFSFEFNLGSKEPLEGFMVHVRGGGDAVAALVKFAKPNNWYLLDCSTGDWINNDNPSEEGWKGFQAYRDRVI